MKYLYKSTICPCMDCCCHICAGALSCFLELLDKPQKQICRNVGPLLAASLEPWAHLQNVASLSIFYKCYFGIDILQNWCSWFYFLFLEEGLLIILMECMTFLSPFLDVTRMSMSTVSSLAQLDSGITYILRNLSKEFLWPLNSTKTQSSN